MRKNVRTSTNWNLINNNLSQAIIENDCLSELLNDLGCEIDDSIGRDRFRMRCPVHEGDDANVEVVIGGYDVPIRWSCYSQGCHKEYKPSLLGLVRGALSAREGDKVSMREAVDYLTRFAGDIDLHHSPRRPKPKPTARYPMRATREQARSRLTIPSPYFIERGFTADVLDDFDVGESRKQRRPVVPLYDDRGLTCVGYIARSVFPHCDRCKKHHYGPECRYGQSKWELMEGFPKKDYLFNYARARATDCPFVFLVEGTPDVLRLAEAGYVGVALLGTEASTVQLQKLGELDKEIWLAFDNDQAGEKAVQRLMDATGLTTVHFRVPEQYKDIGEMPPSELRDAVREQVEGMVGIDEMLLIGSGGREADDEFLKESRKRLREHEEWLRRSPQDAALRPVSPSRSRKARRSRSG